MDFSPLQLLIVPLLPLDTASMMEFDDLLASSLVPFIALSNQIGGLVQEQAALLLESFKRQRAFIEMAGKSAKPATDAELVDLLKPLNGLASAIHVSIRHIIQFSTCMSSASLCFPLFSSF